MKINLLIAPYRDSYFYADYGPAVRDLQFIHTLANIDAVDSIVVLNRPVSVLECVLFRKVLPKSITHPKIKTINTLSGDLFGAIKGRSWAGDVYEGIINKYLKESNSESCLNVFLDFLPIGTFDSELLRGWVYWYDFIDNFKKHNRFTEKEKILVNHKYDFVSSYADLVTGVTKECLHANGPFKSKEVISNKLFLARGDYSMNKIASKQFDFGFIGFVTDKFDVNFVERLAKDFTIGVFGQVLDRDIGRRLKGIENVTLHGKFKYRDVAKICSQFSIGLLPYLVEKSHDGSPLKLYEYMKYSLPCLTSIDYEIKDGRFIRNYNKTVDLFSDIEDMKNISGSDEIIGSIKEEWKIESALMKIIDKHLEKARL